VAAPSGEPTAAWTAELERTGSVVFPQRRRRLWVRLAVIVLYSANTLWSIVDDVRQNELASVNGFLDVFTMALVLSVAGFTVWQIVTRRPTLIVDRDGIHKGRRKRGLAWNEIVGVGEPTGIAGARSLPILPQDRWSKAFRRDAGQRQGPRRLRRLAARISRPGSRDRPRPTPRPCPLTQVWGVRRAGSGALAPEAAGQCEPSVRRRCAVGTW
jgi:hypothetical protein